VLAKPEQQNGATPQGALQTLFESMKAPDCARAAAAGPHCHYYGATGGTPAPHGGSMVKKQSKTASKWQAMMHEVLFENCKRAPPPKVGVCSKHALSLHHS
jgi:hypothetical protein